MRALTDQAALEWCNAIGLRLHEGRLRFAEDGGSAIILPLPTLPYRVPWLGLDLFDIDAERPTECLLWVREWTVWSELMTDIGVGHFNRLRRSYGVETSLEEGPALLMGGHEVHAVATFAVFPILFGWDAYLVSAARDHLAYISHDEQICILTRNPTAQSALLDKLKDWSPVIKPIPCWA
jgi:hypothetical protein